MANLDPMSRERNRDQVQLFDVFVGYKRRYVGVTARRAAEILQLDEWEITSFVQEAGRCDGINAAGMVCIAVETGDKPSNHPMRGDS